MGERTKSAAKVLDAKTENSASQSKKLNFSHSINSPIDQILFLQRTVGNQAVEKLLKSGFIQAKLTIGQPGDIYEQEADRVADQVMRMPDPSTAGRKGDSKYSEVPSIQRMCTDCEEELHRQPMEEEEEEILQTKEVGGETPGISQDVESQINSVRGGGQPLPESVRAFFEPRFGQDFGEVRVHTDNKADMLSRSVNALAFTVGKDVVFGAGQYSMGSIEGKRLLAHELTHVIQQRPKSHSFNANTLQKQPETCPPDRVEEPEHPGKCPNINRESGERERFTALGLFVDTIVPFKCYMLTNFRIGDTDLGVLAELNDIADLLMADLNIAVHITGYTDCLGRSERNANLRMNRAAVVEDYFINVLGIDRARIFIQPTEMTKYVDTNETVEGRARNRSVVIYLEHGPTITPTLVPEPPVCTAPASQSSSGKRCKFYVYDNTEPTGMAWKWEVAALALAALRPGAYVLPSGDSIEEALEHIINSNATEGCDCIEEVQFFSHGSSGNAMSISKTNDEITIKDFNIPELDKFGYGPTSMSGYREWADKLSVRQRRLVLLRRLLCGPDAEIYYRSCEAFQGKTGQEFAKASTEFWRSKVVGHTKVIGLSQPGKKALKPCQEPYWPESEGAGAPSGKKGKHKLRDIKPK
jgi:hypothetical protein